MADWDADSPGLIKNLVGGALARFEQTLHSAVAALDERYASGQELDGDGLAAVIDLSGWALESGRTPCSCGTGFRLSCVFARGPTTATARPAPQR